MKVIAVTSSIVVIAIALAFLVVSLSAAVIRWLDEDRQRNPK